MSADLLTDEELARQFDITTRRLHELRRRHSWPCVRLGKSEFRFTPEQVAEIKALMTHRVTHSGPGVPAAPVNGQTVRSAKSRRSA